MAKSVAPKQPTKPPEVSLPPPPLSVHLEEWMKPIPVKCQYCGTGQIPNLEQNGALRCVACGAPLGIFFTHFTEKELRHG